MILQPCNVELTKVHYYEGPKREKNLAISTISREVCQNDFNRNVLIKRNVFGHRWVLKINDGDGGDKKRTKLKLVVYILVFCSLVVAVCFGIFFSLYKNRHKPSDRRTVQFRPVTNFTNPNSTYVYKTHENQATLQATEDDVDDDTTEKTTTNINVYVNVPSTSTTSTICGTCSANQVCLKIEETDSPRCVNIVDKNDPTGCGGLCPINTHFCQTLDVRGEVYQCSPVKKALVCPNNTFNCGNMCIPLEKRCDGLMHCSDGSDEDDCACDLETHFHCGNSTSCLDKGKKCDRKVDCWDKSDELNCSKVLLCNEEQIPCTSGQCVPKEKFCDGKLDCLDRTDEPEGCQI